jgi:hypothetical protein
MKRAYITASAVLCLLLANTSAPACGDKLLHLSRIHRRHTNSNFAVLVYSRPDSLLQNAADLHLEKTFHDEGYSVLFAKSEREVALALQSGAANAVISDIADAESVARLKSPIPFLLIPVLAKGDNRSEDSVRQYPATIKAPARPDRYLDALDRAFDSKLGRQTAKLQPISRPIR